jgi:hypothetical protein
MRQKNEKDSRNKGVLKLYTSVTFDQFMESPLAKNLQTIIVDIFVLHKVFSVSLSIDTHTHTHTHTQVHIHVHKDH